MVLLGSTSLQLALLFCCCALIFGFASFARRDQRFFIAAQRSIAVSGFLVLFAALILLQRLIVNDFRLEYVATFSSATTPVIYRIAGLWAGMEGSLLLWIAVLGVCIISVNRPKSKQDSLLLPVANLVLATIMLFFLIVTIFFENPFAVLPAEVMPIADGMGLNPLLQHPIMLIHPPILYLGYVGFSVPFAFAIAALVTKRWDAAWIRATRNWTLLSWLFLGIGIILGGRWAYAELGWGGYWSWDPVENASLLPWLTASAYIHSIRVQYKKDMLRLWNVILIMTTFILTIFGTYLTRSGILSSVHAFAATKLGTWFLGFMLIIILSCVLLVVLRKEELGSRRRVESFTSRESGFLFNNMIFIALVLAVLWGTMFPLLSEAVRGTQITIGASYFNSTTVPIGLLLLLMTGIGPFLAWRRTSLDTLRHNLGLPVVAAIVAAAVSVIMGIRQAYPVITVGLIAFALAGIISEILRGISARRRSAGESIIVALRNMIDRNRSRYAGAIVHFGVLFLFAGFAGRAFNTEQELAVDQGDTFFIRDYVFTLERYYEVEQSNYIALVADLAVSRNDRPVTVLKPELRIYDGWESQVQSEVAIHSRPLRDLYAILGGVNSTDDSLALRIMVNPLVQMVWLGGIIITIGTLVAVKPSSSDRRLKEQMA